MTEEEKQKEQEEKDRYRFSGYHWQDNGKDNWEAPTIPVKPEPTWWGKKAISTQPL